MLLLLEYSDQERLSSDMADQRCEGQDRVFGAGLDDIIIVPVAAVAYIVRSVFRALLRLLVRLLDYAFPILLQVARFPLFTLRIIGDALAALARGVIALLPIGGDRRAAWREYVSQAWAWLRAKISYKAFEEYIHHLFEDGMAWVFRTCRTLSPTAALLVLVGAILWLPISFALATGMHAILFAKVAVWPAWLQLLHPVATIIAKSKLLVLPAYPAAWPRAKEHPLVQSLMAFGRYVAAHYIVRKTVYRYRQTAYVAHIVRNDLARAAERAGVTRVGQRVLAAINAAAAWAGAFLRRAAVVAVSVLSSMPLIGAVVRRYASHYEAVPPEPAEKLSKRVSGFYARWSVKLTAEYYEEKDRAEAAKASAAAAKPASAA